MTNAGSASWPYPGSRWWKFDFHTHTPASKDTREWQANAGTESKISPKAWLLQFMAAEVDCVAVTDHNTGQWIDKLKATYHEMKVLADQGHAVDQFRELTIFPGVEISVQGDFHLLALFDPSKGSDHIEAVLGRVEYDGTRGDTDGVTKAGAYEAVRAVVEMGGIPIPAHADRKGSGGKALLAVQENSAKCLLDTSTVRQVIEIPDLLAVEWEDLSHPFPAIAASRKSKLSKVLGSDSHSFSGKYSPGSRYTWIKMANPTLEGLRLALLDGNGISVRRSDEGEFMPFEMPEHFITRLKVDSARFMGNGEPTTLSFSPFYNAIIGGRGAGKSTSVQAIRLAFRRGHELDRLGESTEPYRHFKNFAEVARQRDGTGALRENTEIVIDLMRSGLRHRLRWRLNDSAAVQERDSDGQWHESASQEIGPDRFPLRIFSQGQIAAMAGEGRQALLGTIDEAASISDHHRRFAEAKHAYFAKSARLRELEEKMRGRPETERKLDDARRKLSALEQSHNAKVLKAHQKGLHQRREVDATLQDLDEMPFSLNSIVDDFALDDWPERLFDESADSDIQSWRSKVDEALSECREALRTAADKLSNAAKKLRVDSELENWRKRNADAESAYHELRATLEEKGVESPAALVSLVQERHQLEDALKRLDRIDQEHSRLLAEIERQRKKVLDARISITEARSEFVATTLKENDFVRIEVVEFGFEPRAIERDLRELLDVQDERFANEILSLDQTRPCGGLAFEIAESEDRRQSLDNVKGRITRADGELGGHFKNFLQRKLEKPEFKDHVQCWFPEDDLRIEYSRQDGENWHSINQGSQGQRSAALLAFLLAFGDEPLILDQPEDDLDNRLIYDLIVRQIRNNKLRRQLIVVTHNPNVLINGDAEMVHALGFRSGQCVVVKEGALQERDLREEVCQIMEGGREAFARRWARLGREN